MTPQGTDTPTAMATTFERLIESLPDADADAEVEVGTEVADAAVVDAVDAGDGDSVALAVEAAVVVGTRSLGTPIWQYASNTPIALDAWAEAIDESQERVTADVIIELISELESVQKHV